MNYLQNVFVVVEVFKLRPSFFFQMRHSTQGTTILHSHRLPYRIRPTPQKKNNEMMSKLRISINIISKKATERYLLIRVVGISPWVRMGRAKKALREALEPSTLFRADGRDES